ncbi:SEC-C metal-binding domain-containing protein [Fluviispira sanaruensis]|uniref:Preprotein translocase subunit SecA n=1 Tax=Fluviispira sanaruensis TaxID=2493639 RepID=A0A4P2VM54_FLUSA|nr:SEC-C metal-binding domain-containing protein [Fluviispira sanaruensis]BBH53094.1 hypothetical protein JCM31447_15370 [Fluviispira sanaruensis]
MKENINLKIPQNTALEKLYNTFSYEKFLEEIRLLCKQIAIKISYFNPLELLNKAYWEYVKSNFGNVAEADLSREQIDSYQLLEFIQTCIISFSPQKNYSDLNNEDFVYIKTKVKKLFSKLDIEYYLIHFSSDKYVSIFSKEEKEIYLILLSSWISIRGKRYLNHEKEHLVTLLSPHNEALEKIFNVNGEQIADGINEMIIHLISGPKKLNEFMSFYHNNIEGLNNNSNNYLNIKNIFDDIFKFELFNVKKVTNLPTLLLEALSHEPGQDQFFFDTLKDSKYSGTPFKRSPIFSFPLLKINDNYYTFHPYIFCDHLYRNIQSIILNQDSNYSEIWNEKQKNITEKLPFELFTKNLPNAQSFYNFYYLGKDKLGKNIWIECDGIILFDQFLFILEVKSGKGSIQSPIENIASHLKIINDLLVNPAEQGRRFLKHFKENKSIELYDSNKKSKKVIYSLEKNKIKKIAIVAVSLEQLTDISSRIQHFQKFALDIDLDPVWIVSIDDLRVYRDILCGPIIFTHFIVKRLEAFKNDKLYSSDELDHLGLYLEKNCYSDDVNKVENNKIILPLGYRNRIDEYYFNLLCKSNNTIPPSQNLPITLKNLLDILEKEAKPGFIWVGHHLLDFDNSTRILISNKIADITMLQISQGIIRPFTILSEISFSFVILTPNINLSSNFIPKDYALSNMLIQKKEESLLLIMNINKLNQISSCEFFFLSNKDLNDGYSEKIKNDVKLLIQQRINTYFNINKLGRNDKCPCGSGKKYKKCHINSVNEN